MGLGKGLGCSGICAKYILFLVNLAIFVSGAAILAVGIAIRLSDEFKAKISEDTGTEGYLNNALFVAAIYIMIVVGALLFVVGFFGCCGACKESNWMLTVYVILVGVLLLIQIVGVTLAIVFRSGLGESLETEMTNSVTDEYGRDNKQDVTAAWDDMQYTLKCCGSYDQTSYNNSYYTNDTGNVVPMTCCTDAKVSDNGTYYMNITDYNICKTEAATGTGEKYHDRGCYYALTDWTKLYTSIIIGVLVGLGVIQIASICIGCCIKEKL